MDFTADLLGKHKILLINSLTNIRDKPQILKKYDVQ